MSRTFKENEILRQRAMTVFELLCKKQPGEVISYAEIEKALNVPYQNGSNLDFRAAVLKARKKLLVRKDGKAIVTVCDYGVGVRLLTDSEVNALCPEKRAKRSARQLHRGIREMRTVDAKNLSDHEKRAYAMRKFSLMSLRKDANRQLREMREIKVTEALPRRRIKRASGS